MTKFVRFASLFILIGMLTPACAQGAGVPLPTSGSLKTPSVTLAQPPETPTDFTPRTKLSVEKAVLPGAGSKDAYGILVSETLQKANQAYLAGNGEAALTELASESKLSSQNPRLAWKVSQLRAQVLIMMGRSADALEEISRTAELELETFKTDASTVALRGEALVWLGDYESAKAELNKVVVSTANWRMPTSYLGAPANLAELVNMTTAQVRAQVAMGVAELMLGNFEAALNWSRHAEWLLDDVFWVAEHPFYGSVLNIFADMFYGRATNLATLGAAKIALSKRADAGIGDHTRAAGFFKALGYANGQILIDALSAYALVKAGLTDAAVKSADKAVQQALAKGLDDMVWRVEALRGEALLEAGFKEKAEGSFRRAQQSLEQSVGSLTTDRAKRRFGIGKEDVTYRLAQFGIENKNFSQLFEDMERGRARAFVDMLAERKVATREQASLVGELRSLDQSIKRHRISAAAFKTGVGSVREDLNRLLKSRDEVLSRLGKQDEELAQAYSVRAISLEQVQKVLGPNDRLLYAVPRRDDDKTGYLDISRNEVDFVTLRPTSKQLRLLLRDFVETVENPNADQQSRMTGRFARLLKLSNDQKAGTLYVVPSGPFYFVPWGALDLNVPVVVLPTGGWLKRNASSGPSGGTAAAIVVGDPAFHGSFQQLPGARAESLNVAKLYGTAALTGQDATEKRLRKQVGEGVRILHLATHGLFDAKTPLNSSIILSTEKGSRPLTAGELFERPLAADLVVLSACETGVGEAVAGDDFLGLARSFYLGGSKALVNSLWPVEDQGTRLFMETFHQEARSGDLGTAWLKARDAVKAKGFPPSVYGAFILGGAARL